MTIVLGTKLRGYSNGTVGFICPGCKESHLINVDPNDRPQWTYNNNPDAPTFKPSILVKTGHYATHHKTGDPCWCTKNPNDEDWSFKCNICHSFVTDGKIQFLNDCTHPLAGQTVELPNIESYSHLVSYSI